MRVKGIFTETGNMNGLVKTAVLVALLLTGGPALAAGGDAPSSKNPNFAAARKLMDKGDFAGAVPLLEKAIAAEPKDADIQNYLGYSHRKLGDKAKALIHYQAALALKPKHRGANEYLGELYLEMGDLAKAEERLEVLDGACWFGCDEYSDLKEAIAKYKAQTGS
jgi:tetratricopeptide (TPR) repeat protein